jgi:hypothetical protein
LHTIAFLRAHGLAELEHRFAVRGVRHRAYPNLVLLKYSQIDSPMAEPVVQECRGLILDEADDWRPVSFPYRKFFNYAEPLAAPIDWATARVYEKLDGSLMTLFSYAGQWHVASRNVPDGSGSAGAAAFTMADLFWQTWRDLGYALPPVDVDRCYMLELLTPLNRIVVQHTASRIVLHGVRRMSDLAELPPESAADLGWEVVRTYPLATLEQILSAAEAIDPFRAEGYVVCDAAFHRVKVKAPAYVAMAHLKDSLSPRRMLDVIRAGESDEFLSYFPELRPMYDVVKGKVDRLCDEVDADYARLASVAEPREFAAAALKTRWSSALFARRSGKCDSARAFAATCTRQAIERALGETFDTLAAEGDGSGSPDVSSG